MKHAIAIATFIAALSASIATTTTTTPAQADDLVFICHKGLRYDAEQVRFAYKGLLDEPRPVDNRILFGSLLSFLHVDAVKYKKMWDRNYFRRGLVAPKLKANDEEVIEYVARRSTGIGYVSVAPNNPDIEVCGR